MRRIGLAVIVAIVVAAALYTSRGNVANPPAAHAQAADVTALAEGTMKKLIFWPEPRPVAQVAFTDPEGGSHRLADWRGGHVLVNFWATWCAPCRAEMPALDALQAEFGGDRFQVVTIATGRNPLPGITRFFEETGVEHLPLLLDPKQEVAREMGVLGLPTSVLLDAQGREIARMRGDAEWYSDSARAMIAALIGAPG